MVEVLAVILAWCSASLAIALLVGGAVRLRDRRPSRSPRPAVLVGSHR